MQAYFASKAVNIQRHWRGFWSRTYVFDFYARKVYLARVAQLNAKASGFAASVHKDRAAQGSTGQDRASVIMPRHCQAARIVITQHSILTVCLGFAQYRLSSRLFLALPPCIGT